MWPHVFGDLAAYAEEQLAPARRARVERHLAACGRCRASLARIEHGIALAAQLSAEPMPKDVTARIRKRLASGAASGRRAPASAARARGWMPAAAALLAAIAGVALYWQLNRPWIRFDRASAPPAMFERDGRALHDRIRSGKAAMMFSSPDERALWAWLDAQGAPVTTLMPARTPAEASRFLPVGARVDTLAGARSSVLAYEIGGRPVTLSLALARDVPGAPPAGWWSKRVTHRRDASGANTLTWTVGDGTYVLVSELDAAGLEACGICHTSERFRSRLASLR